ncbi:MAG: polysaccharide deacetylase family protein [Chryseobacterium sp.]|jgi:peptidoglycan/xylan/chitin deacetylase (PgdA/CDA1 family)|uniref:polysaccharide deacetylase family protein n=1 Tax=Chryseobacterium sp. TaxID=1871047 RepID=UPI00281BBFD0|nr:polysaccharide deacetylase family protein [Chryseobacterium sp.]MDR2236826.1 polysaccharide deacetylase family protein [Chryseobacterium sp.]
MFRFFKRILGFSKAESIRILMYHKVQPEKNISGKDTLTVTVEDLEEQLQYIKNNYTTLFFNELEANRTTERKLILTFDDGYLNNLQYLIPLLEKYRLKATIFIPTELIQKDENSEQRTMMTFEEIRSLNPECVEIALHSHSHRNYSQISLQEAHDDLRKNIRTLEEQKIPFTKVLAYPYGKFPKKGQAKTDFFSMLEQNEIISALRIGNNMAYFPWKNKFEIKRIDIKGGDSFGVFKWKLRLGKVKL